MSFSAMSWARIVSFGSATRKAIIFVLSDHHNGGSGRCDPGIETIAREADASLRATEINLRWLERAGAITVLRRQGRPNSYILNFAWGVPACQQRTRRTPAPNAGVTMGTPAFECVKQAQTPAPDAPEPERKNLTGKEEEREPPASPPLTQPPSRIEFLVETQQARRSERAPAAPPARSARSPLPDDWGPSPEERRLAVEAGFDPTELVTEMADSARANAARSADWSASFRRWTRRETKFRAARSTPRSSRRTAADTICERLVRQMREMAP